MFYTRLHCAQHAAIPAKHADRVGERLLWQPTLPRSKGRGMCVQVQHKDCHTYKHSSPCRRHPPVGPLAQKLSSAPILRIRSGATPTTSLQMARLSSSSSYTLTHTRSGGRPNTLVDNSQAQQMAWRQGARGGAGNMDSRADAPTDVLCTALQLV